MDPFRQTGTVAIPKHKDMDTLEFDPPDGFIGKVNIFPDPVSSPSYMDLWDWEKNLKFHEWRVWIGTHWRHPVHICFLYVMAIFLGQIWMKRKQPYKLNRLMIIWNVILAVFSLLGFLRSMPEVLHLLDRPNGFYRIVCSRFVCNTRIPCFLHHFHQSTYTYTFWSILLSLGNPRDRHTLTHIHAVALHLCNFIQTMYYVRVCIIHTSKEGV
jgi:hypothetical protein